MKISHCLLVLLILFTGCTSTERKVENIQTFARVYGYVRWFYPGDEAARINWDKFAVYGVNKVQNARNQKQLKRILQKLFEPIAPALIIEDASLVGNFNLQSVIPEDTIGFSSVFWVHYGVYLGEKSNIYKSSRMNRDSVWGKEFKRDDNDVFPENLNVKIGDFIRKDVGNNLVCIMPLALYGNQDHTFPVSDTEAIQQLNHQLNRITDLIILILDTSGHITNPSSHMMNRLKINQISGSLKNKKNLNIRLANVVIAWNIFQHFYPYFDAVDVDWDKVLSETLYDVVEVKTETDYFKSLCRMVAKAEDGHGVVFNENIVQWSLPVAFSWIENEVVVSASASPLFLRGDIVDSIDGKSASEEVLEQEQYISGSPQLKRYRALNMFGSDFFQSEADVILIRDDTKLRIKAQRTYKSNPFFNATGMEKLINKEPDNGIYYLHYLGIKTDKDWEKLLKAKGIILSRFFDAVKIIPHLIREPAWSTDFSVPVCTWPDRENIYFDINKWMIPPQKPFIDVPVVFINDASTVSYGETLLDIIDHYKLGKLVGDTTAGTNGNVNYIPLMGGYSIMWTGMKVLKYDGSRLHLIGFEPDYPVKKTIQAIKEGRDEYLEKALEIIKADSIVR
jgi:hypothetical protein